MKETEKASAPQEKMVGEIAGSVANQATIASAMREGLAQLEDAKIPEEQKVVIGREMLKTLNSQQGKDAIGAEEAKRLGGYLEYQLFNFTQPGKFIGRDVPAFTTQVKNNLGRLEGSIERNEGLLKRARAGQSLVDKTPKNPPPPPGALYAPGQTIYIDGVPHKVGADGKTADPL